MNACFESFFGYVPHDFQWRVAEYLVSGRNVILQAPTGSGKTNTALFPYLLARSQQGHFPRKLLYAVPMRVLAQAFHATLTSTPAGSGLNVRIQSGEQQDDRRLEGDVTFTTIDQILSSFLCIPHSLSLRQGNVNAGAVVGSYLVFDEFHLLDPGSSLPTVLAMLRRLGGVAPFLLMTATFSDPLLQRLGRLLQAEVVTLDSIELAKIQSQRDKIRRFHRVGQPIDADEIIAAHRSRSIAICNTVSRAQELYKRLQSRLEGSDTPVVLLHSRFLRSHRREKVEKIVNLFGPQARPFRGSAILVATQVIEVGLDITCETLHTEIAPASAVLQRAGRCARFAGEEGNVFIYHLPMDRRGRPDTSPYLDDQAELVQRTWDSLPDIGIDHVDFAKEQGLIDAVHGPADIRMLDALGQTRHAHWTSMSQAIDQQEFGLARQLIRADDSVTVLVHPDPGPDTDPFALEGFSVFPGVLLQQYRRWQDGGVHQQVGWLLRYPREAPTEAGSEHERRRRQYEWIPLASTQEIARTSVLVINPRLVSYDNDLGFQFEPGRDFASPSAPTQERPPRHGYKRETYAEHIANVLRAFDDGPARDMTYASHQLEQRIGLPPGAIEQATKVAIALHDAGKLNQRWQHWARTWQRRVGQSADPGPLAHTDFDPIDRAHHLWERELAGQRPPHAVEGAVAIAAVVHRLFGTPKTGDAHALVLKATISAIARHHSPRASEVREPFVLIPNAAAVLAQVLDLAGVRAAPVDALRATCQAGTNLGGFIVRAGDADGDALLLYWLIVRALRLADQCSFRNEEESVPT